MCLCLCLWIDLLCCICVFDSVWLRFGLLVVGLVNSVDFVILLLKCFPGCSRLFCILIVHG